MGFMPHPHQVEDWIQERLQQLEEPLPPGKDKLKHLQKHQAFKAEVQAHEDIIITVTKVMTRPSAPSLPQKWIPGWPRGQVLGSGGEGYDGGKARGRVTGKFPRCPLRPQEGEALLAQSHPGAEEVSQRLRALQEHWEKLRQAVALQGQDLEDTQNFLNFLQRVDLAEAWIQDMVRPRRTGQSWGWGSVADR